MKHSRWLVWPVRLMAGGLLLTLFVGPLEAAATLRVSQQRCEYKQNPVGIDTPQPRLSWTLAPARPGLRALRQSAWQVLVATSPDLLKKDQGDLWDSGKVASDQSVNIEYAGRPLRTAQACYWKMRVWDQDGAVSAWSPVQQWTMGVLDPADWQARWISFGRAPGALSPGEQMKQSLLRLEGSSWVWTTGAKAGNQPPGEAFFRKVIEIPAQKKLTQAAFLIAADDGFTLYVNGHDAGNGSSWKTPVTLDVTGRLQPGRNALGIRVRNGGENPSPAGLLGRLVLLFESGDPMVVPIDATWLSTRQPGERWKWADDPATGWQPASVIAAYGDQPWGKVSAAFYAMEPAACLRKEFVLDKPVRRAVLFASALGVYALHLNGKPAGPDVLSPGWTDYRKRVHYFGYDVTRQLRQGPNALGAVLGDGWYAGYLAFTGKRHYYGEQPQFLAQMFIEFADGTTRVLGTDASWKAAHGPVRENDLLMGSVYDARLEMPGWDRPGFNDTAWAAARVHDETRARLEAHPGLPMTRVQELPARSVTEPKPGVYVFDLGQNMVGWVRLKLKGERGQKVTVRHAEMLQKDGTLYVTNLRAARATDVFYLAGGPARDYEPSFTFHGFQYVEVTGLDYKPSPRDVVGIVVHSDLPRAGWFECDNPLVNKLSLNTLWGQKGNFLDVPTDCPQRDERAGWTGDAQVFMKTACLNMDAPAFFTKWLVDLCQDSQREDGGFGDVAPHVNIVSFGNTGWSDAGVVCNYRMLQMYGDTRVVRQHYPALVRYMDYLAKTSTNHVRGTGAYGDWLRLAGPQHSDVIGTAYYYYSASLMAELAAVAGRSDDAARYRALAGEIKAVFAREFVKDDGRIVDKKGETGQTFYALAFGLDLVPQDKRAAAAAHFAGTIAAQNGHIATGFLGTPFILFALEKAGRLDLAYQLALNKTYPSWLLQVTLGSTTMWERWDGWLPDKGFQDPGMNSFNHYWLGVINEWLLTVVAGLDTEGPGFSRITIRPRPDPRGQGFNRARGVYDSIRGRISSEWRREKDGLRLTVEVPANTVATVYVPASDPAKVRESGKAAAQARGVKFLRAEPGYAVFEVGSGRYEFR